MPRILIVDDEAPHVRALCDTLRAHDFDTLGVGSANAALDILRGGSRFDLLLADLMMPDTDGIGLVQSARQVDADLACIIMTGEGSIASAVRAMKVGALDYVVKPFKVSALLPVLSRALETRRLRIKNASLEQHLRERNEELLVLNRDLQLAREQADSANAAKSVFLSNMSHELRTPLNAILGFSQILGSDTLPTSLEDKKRFAHNILHAGRHLLTLINEILDLAKVESGAMSMSLEAVMVDDILSECHAMTEPLAHARGVTLQIATDCGLCVHADRTRLKQILLNLLSNAIKYNREHGSVFAHGEAVDGGRVRIAVRDTGAGLDAGQLSAIFQPFNRLGREGLHEEGTGIGLALTKRLVEAMQGAIALSSEPGVGSTFTVELPASVHAPARARLAAGSSAAGADATPIAPRTVLYVEDNPTNQQLVTELVRLRADLELVCADDAQQGIDIARARLPDLILLDINLPGMDGITACRILRSDPRTASIPIIAISASAMPGDIRRGLQAGFFRYVTKPIELAAFTEAIDSALATRGKTP